MGIVKNDITKFINNSIYSVVKNRPISMGLSMLMVFFYHFDQIHFYPGFLGVDLFLFLSTYGLCNSFEKYSLGTFYKRRIIRIVPMFMMMGIGACMIACLSHHSQLSAWDWFCNISSLNYYGLGGFVFEWYLCFLLLVYLLFPLLYKLCKSAVITRMGGSFLLSAVLVMSLFLLTKGFNWYYNTAIGRVPICIMGILCYPFSENSSFLKKSLLFGLGFLTAIYLYHAKMCNTYVLLYMLAPIVIVLLGWLVSIINKVIFVKRIVEAIGKNTLEIYVANVLVCLYRTSPENIFLNQPLAVSLLLYLILNTLLALLFICINHTIKAI